MNVYRYVIVCYGMLFVDHIIFGLFYCVFFFFKQKTAYEMRISDWSSDVCSDLSCPPRSRGGDRGRRGLQLQEAPQVMTRGAAEALREEHHQDDDGDAEQQAPVGELDEQVVQPGEDGRADDGTGERFDAAEQDRKSTRLNYRH